MRASINNLVIATGRCSVEWQNTDLYDAPFELPITMDVSLDQLIRARVWLNERRMRLKKGAYRRGIEFALNIKDVELIYEDYIKNENCKCPYCLETLLNPSVDRVDNKIGYTPDNCMLVCGRCNAIKNNLSITQIENIYKYVTRK